MTLSSIRRSPAGLPTSGLLLAGLLACGQKSSQSEPPREHRTAPRESTKQVTQGQARQGEAAGSSATRSRVPRDLPNALLIAYAQFEVEGGAVTRRPGPARLDVLQRQGGMWITDTLEDPESRVFHKAMVVHPKGQTPGIVTLAGSSPCPAENGDGPRDCDAQLKLWRRAGPGWESTELWSVDFGGAFNRMRDAEVGPLLEDNSPALAVGTHDQGVVAVVAFEPQPRTIQLDQKEDTFVHEIELGDLDGDGNPEIYATPSEPNRLREGGVQHGEVVRYSPRGPRAASSRTVVADLGNRHAKEILVTDVDGDGRDELYVVVEALTRTENGQMQIVEPVEIRRYEHGTDPKAGAVIATLPDRFTRFLTAGDLDGDGKREMVAAAFKSGLWLLRPGDNPTAEWSKESIDRDSGGFEHASLVTDLDGDGTDELYVAADEQGELRRYVWVDGRAEREVIHRRDLPRSRITWNLMRAPRSVVAPEAQN